MLTSSVCPTCAQEIIDNETKRNKLSAYAQFVPLLKWHFSKASDVVLLYFCPAAVYSIILCCVMLIINFSVVSIILVQCG